MVNLIAPELVRAELDSINDGSEFRQSPRHRNFLRYLVEQSLAGNAASLKEISLGVAVFERNPGTFDPTHDSIVRVEARRLRSRLVRHYLGEGRDSLIVIALVAGSYVPIVTRRDRSETFRGVPMIAVLPFANMTGDERIDRWCDGLTEDVTDALARTAGLRVVARTSAFHFKGQRIDVRAIAQALDAGMVVEGSVRSYESHRKVTAQVIDASSGIHLWSEQFDANADSYFLLPERVSQAVLNAVVRTGTDAGARLKSMSSGASSPRFTTELQRDLYERARIAFQQRTIDGYRLAEALFAQLAASATNSPHAYCGLARTALALAGMSVTPVRVALPQARIHAEHALVADPTFGEAYAVMGQVALLLDHDWTRAEKCFMCAIRYAPSVPFPQHMYAFGLLYRARYEEAESAFEFARRIDPLDIHIRVQSALVPFYKREFSEAIERWSRVLEIRPDNLVAITLVGSAWLGLGRPELALIQYEAARTRAPDHPIGYAGAAQAHAMLGQQSRASEMLLSMQTMAATNYVSPYLFALVYTRFSDHDAAFAWLTRSAVEPDFNFVCAGLDPGFDALRGDRRWIDLMTEHGMPVAATPGSGPI